MANSRALIDHLTSVIVAYLCNWDEDLKEQQYRKGPLRDRGATSLPGATAIAECLDDFIDESNLLA